MLSITGREISHFIAKTFLSVSTKTSQLSERAGYRQPTKMSVKRQNAGSPAS
jgi:hypothetical protein